jgi:hypothetical protein
MVHLLLFGLSFMKNANHISSIVTWSPSKSSLFPSLEAHPKVAKSSAKIQLLVFFHVKCQDLEDENGEIEAQIFQMPSQYLSPMPRPRPSDHVTAFCI